MTDLTYTRISRSSRLAFLAALSVAAVALLLAAGPAAAKKSKTFQKNATLNAPIPDEPAVGPPVALRTTITVPKKFKKNVVGDVNVTLQTVGVDPDSSEDLSFKLTAPGGRTVYLITNNNNGLIGPSIGPLTLDDESQTVICNDTTPCSDPYATLGPPFAGTANLQGLGNGGTGPLVAFDGVKMRGAWTLAVWDNVTNLSNTLVGWGLRVKPAKPVAE